MPRPMEQVCFAGLFFFYAFASLFFFTIIFRFGKKQQMKGICRNISSFARRCSILNSFCKTVFQVLQKPYSGDVYERDAPRHLQGVLFFRHPRGIRFFVPFAFFCTMPYARLSEFFRGVCRKPVRQPQTHCAEREHLPFALRLAPAAVACWCVVVIKANREVRCASACQTCRSAARQRTAALASAPIFSRGA